MMEIVKKCMIEFIGTFFLMFTVSMSLFSPGTATSAAFAVGLVLMVMIYAGGHVSGGHYNPAVSLAAAIRGALSWKDFGPYVASQLLGGVLGGLLSTMFVIPPVPNADPFPMSSIIIGEFLFTFALCFVVLHVATSVDNEKNSFYGLAIGATVVVGAIATSKICFGAFNPAVALSFFSFGSMTAATATITIITNFAAGAIAALAYKATNNDEE